MRDGWKLLAYQLSFTLHMDVDVILSWPLRKLAEYVEAHKLINK